MNLDKIKIFLIGLIVVVAVLGLYFGFYTQTQANLTSSEVQNGAITSPQVEKPVISGQDAKLISVNVITESGAYPGNPTLYKMPDGQLIWNIPVISNHKVIGYVYVDATTGKVVS